MSSDKFTDVLAHAPTHNILTADVVGKLQEHWGELPAAEIGAKSKLTLVKELAVFLPQDAGHSNGDRLEIATVILKTLDDFGFVSHAPVTQVVKIEQDKPFGQMTLQELLEHLAGTPSVYADILPFIQGNPRITTARRKAGDNWAVPTGDGKLDTTKTTEYIDLLNRPHGSVQREVNGRRPTNLADIFEQNTRALLQPFQRKAFYGPTDDFGFDWSEQGLNDEKLHETAVWIMLRAVFGDPHPLAPRIDVLDPYLATQELFNKTKRWMSMKGDFLYAQRHNDPVAKLVDRYWDSELSFDQYVQQLVRGVPQVGKTSGYTSSRDPEAEAREYVIAACTGNFETSGMNLVVPKRVFRRVRVSGMSLVIQRCVAIEGGSATGMNISGAVYVPRGVRFSWSGMGANIEVIECSWSKLRSIIDSW
jgi:hypothetical protein